MPLDKMPTPTPKPKPKREPIPWMLITTLAWITALVIFDMIHKH